VVVYWLFVPERKYANASAGAVPDVADASVGRSKPLVWVVELTCSANQYWSVVVGVQLMALVFQPSAV
jgi:hypothetical protein